MKKNYLILFLILASTYVRAQLYVGASSQVNLTDGEIFYSKPNVQNEGIIQYLGANPIGDFYLDGGLDNSLGTLTLGDAILHIGSGNTQAINGLANSEGNHTFKFNASNDQVKFVEFNKANGIITVDTDPSGGELEITNTFTTDGNGTLNANDRVVLKSTSIANTAIVPESTGGTVNGIRVERFIPADRAYRMMASPVNTDGSIFDNWQNGGVYTPNVGTHITGSGYKTFPPFAASTTASGFDINGSGTSSMFVYDYTVLDWQALVESSTDLNYNNTNTRGLNVSEPYYILIRGDRSIDLQWNSAANIETVLNQTGSLRIGTENNSFTLGGDEYVAIANPYQAPVDMSLLMPTGSTEFKDQMWVWSQTDRNSGQFAQVDNLSGTPSSSIPGFADTKFLQPGQSIFIQTKTGAAASQSINFQESFKATLGDLVDMYRGNTNQYEGFLRLGLYDARHKPFEDLAYDGFVIQFDNQYDNNVDDLDGQKLFNNRENMAIEVENTLLSTNKRKLPEDLNEIIDISVYNLKNKDYKFSVDLEGFESLPEGIMLWDKYNDSFTPLEDQQVISFSVDSSIPETSSENRFALVFENTTLGINDQELGNISVYPNPVTSNYIDIQFSRVSNADTTVELFDLLGKNVLTQKFKNVQKNLRLDNLDLSTGVYLLNVKQNNQTKTFKIIKE